MYKINKKNNRNIKSIIELLTHAIASHSANGIFDWLIKMIKMMKMVQLLQIATQNVLPLPFGITPGSINVASVKFAITKNVITPWYAGTHGYLYI